MTTQTLNPVEIKREQIAVVFRQLPTLLLMELLGGCFLFLFVLLVGANDSPLANYWFTFVVLTVSIRYLWAREIDGQRQGSTRPHAKQQLLYFTAIISSLVWGSTWILVVPFDSIEAPRGATMLWSCAMLAAAATNLSVSKKLFFTFAIPVILQHNLVMLLMGNPAGLRYSIGMTAFLTFVSVLAIRVSRDLNYTIRLRLHNNKLQADLQADQESLGRQRAELLAGIAREKALMAERGYCCSGTTVRSRPDPEPRSPRNPESARRRC